MTYHIDLLLDDERRHATPVHMRMVLRLGVTALVALMLLATLLLFLSTRGVHLRVLEARTHWHNLQDRHGAWRQLRGELQDERTAMRQLQACQHARIEWGEELAVLQRGVPGTIQLTELRVSQFVGVSTSDACTVRSYDLRLSGRVGGDDANACVQQLLDHMSAASRTDRVASVSVPPGAFRRDVSRGAARTDWLFDVVCNYRPRAFE